MKDNKEEMTVRESILASIERIKEEEDGFLSPKWEKFMYSYFHISDAPIAGIPDRMLFDLYEEIIKWKHSSIPLEPNLKTEVLTFEQGERVNIPVGMIEFNVGGNTIWVQSPFGATTMRIKCNGKIRIDKCENNPVSHSDMIVEGDINFCLSSDAKK